MVVVVEDDFGCSGGGDEGLVLKAYSYSAVSRWELRRLVVGLVCMLLCFVVFYTIK